MAARRFLIRGVVQGVGFRFAMCEQAEQLGLDGWVRNRRDGTVEALAVGAVAALDVLQQWAVRGPRGARVDAVEIAEVAEDAAALLAGTGFRQAPTV